MDNKDKGIEFLNDLYKDLYKSDEVMHRVDDRYIGNKIDNIDNYLKRLEEVHMQANQKERYKELLKELYYKKYVIKEENIKGYNANKEEIINNQKRSLSKWIDYLSDDNTNYPMWQKYWIFQGMLKIGTYDEANDTYMKRNNKTTAAFIDINPEVLAKCVELLNSYLDEKQIEEKDFEKIVQNGNFTKLYTALLNREKKVKNSLNAKDDGIWIKYNGFSDDYIKLSKSLDGKGTGWCTAGKETAKKQLNGGSGYPGGDFYVYYTKDENNKYENPRIAIRMEGTDTVGEIRGIDNSQNMEEGFEEIAFSKLKELNVKNIERELKKVDNCRELTRLNRKVAGNNVLTKEEIEFIFSDIETFGWGSDPRVEKIKDKIFNDSYNIEYFFENLSEQEILELIKKDIRFFGKMSAKKQTPELCIQVVKIESYALQYVKEQTPEICLEAVRRNGLALRYVKEQTPKICLIAVKRSGGALKYVKEQTPEICLEAVKNNGAALEYVERQTLEICMEAVKENGFALKYVKEQTPEICWAAVQQSGRAIQYVKEQTPEICMAAVKQDGWAIESVKEQTPELCLEAVKQNGIALSRIKNQTPEICMAAVKQNGKAIAHVKEQTPEICLAAVKENGYALAYIKERTLEICLAAVHQNPDALRFVPPEFQDTCEPIAKEREIEIACESMKKELEIEQTTNTKANIKNYLSRLKNTLLTKMSLREEGKNNKGKH